MGARDELHSSLITVRSTDESNTSQIFSIRKYEKVRLECLTAARENWVDLKGKREETISFSVMKCEEVDGIS